MKNYEHQASIDGNQYYCPCCKKNIDNPNADSTNDALKCMICLESQIPVLLTPCCAKAICPECSKKVLDQHEYEGTFYCPHCRRTTLETEPPKVDFITEVQCPMTDCTFSIELLPGSTTMIVFRKMRDHLKSHSSNRLGSVELKRLELKGCQLVCPDCEAIVISAYHEDNQPMVESFHRLHNLECNALNNSQRQWICNFCKDVSYTYASLCSHVASHNVFHCSFAGCESTFSENHAQNHDAVLADFNNFWQGIPQVYPSAYNNDQEPGSEHLDPDYEQKLQAAIEASLLISTLPYPSLCTDDDPSTNSDDLQDSDIPDDTPTDEEHTHNENSPSTSTQVAQEETSTDTSHSQPVGVISLCYEPTYFHGATPFHGVPSGGSFIQSPPTR